MDKTLDKIIEQFSFLEEIINSMNVLVHIDNLDETNLAWGNRIFDKILGFTAKEISEMGIAYLREYYHPEDYKTVQQTIEYFKKEKGESYTTLFRVKHKNGHWLYLYTVRTLFKRKPTGEPWLVLSVTMDVTNPVNAGTQIEQLLKENFKLKNNLILSTFTKREFEILKLIAAGNSNKAISTILYISENTVEKHRSNLMKKSNCKNIAQLISFAIENSLM